MPVAFTEQLTQLLQSHPLDEWLDRICGLISVHTGANVLLTGEAGRVIAHQLLPDEISPSLPVNSEKLLSLIIEKDKTIGQLTLYRREGVFNNNEKMIISISVPVFTMILRVNRERSEEEHRRRITAVKSVLNTLSFSELEAAVKIFQALNGNEGLLVTGRIADESRITRSVAVNSLRKLEGAGMIETRSLGMKGTYIKVLDSMLSGELEKLRH